MALTPDDVKSILRQVKYPGYSRDIVSFGLVKGITVEGDRVVVDILLPKPDEELGRTVSEEVRRVLSHTEGVGDVDVRVSARQPQQRRPAAPEAPKLPDVKYYVAVASGKGGVGKSTVAVNLALALSRLRPRVGLLDADIYGPSVPTMLGIKERPVATEDRKIIPLEKNGLKLMSIGFLIDEDDAVVWRGPMVHGAIKQFIEDVRWEGVDYLVIDLPPGTGDAHLSLIQNVPLSGGIIVTTPQEVALIDVKRGINMFKRLNVPVLGVIENMSHLVTPGGEVVDIFGRGGGRRMAERFDVPFLGEIPIDPRIREGGDRGEPIVLSHPDSESARAFGEIARRVVEMLEGSS